MLRVFSVFLLLLLAGCASNYSAGTAAPIAIAPVSSAHAQTMHLSPGVMNGIYAVESETHRGTVRVREMPYMPAHVEVDLRPTRSELYRRQSEAYWSDDWLSR